jgi:hypothetical protein
MGDIPRKEAEFVEWSGNLIAVSKANITEWGLPEAQVTDLETLHGQFKTLYEKCQTRAHTALDTQVKNEVKAALIKKEQDFIRFHLQNNEKMTNAGREALRISIRDTKPTHHPPPDSHPVISTESRNPLELILHIRDSKSGKRARPAYTNGAVLFWSVSDTPITNQEELKTSALVTRTPYIMSFSPTERGKIVYMAGRWQIAGGKKASWSEVESAVIP